VAVDPEADDRHALVQHQHALATHCPGLRREGWLGAEDLHLTLAFLGDLAADAAATVEERCARLAAATPPGWVQLQRLEGWPSTPPRCLVLTGEAAPALTRLQAALAAALPAAAREHHAWRPHVTLFRGALGGADLAHLALPPWRMTARTIALFVREAGAPGRRYRRLRRWALAGAADPPAGGVED
jgi:2'-5' RNA ligase